MIITISKIKHTILIYSLILYLAYLILKDIIKEKVRRV